ncbi:hypothetical protein POL68_11545 [Stigmatella sp. ncwal1]|uniref:Lipoprotein n=1 Tax=Stigmatella ashevillensis TaxID=2995309 RepID=A0ABT5D9W4_9BACT|nr:hypothetical protein [Stigmatella ashevillena]MDC0709097.1 hypothetical protein [Stigmatella ashevillena]
MGRMGWLGCALWVLCTACGASKPAVRAPAGQGASKAEATVPARHYVDAELGLEIVRPAAEWQLDEPEKSASSDGAAIPVILRNRMTGAQVVLQVAPAVASPTQIAEQLNRGLSEQPDFVASELEPLPLSDSAVGFDFQVGQGVHGRVAVKEGSPGRLFMMLATWPADASADCVRGVEDLFGAVRPLPEPG